MEEYDALIIGGGGTGAALAYDLALRGLSVALFERGELCSGTTGRHHGQLHSGARYALGDPRIARECMAETRILRRIAPDSLEYNQGIFISLDLEEEALTDDFILACRNADIPAVKIPVRRALELEGRINPATRSAVLVPDGTIDAYRLVMRFFASAVARGATIRNFHEVVGIDSQAGAVSFITVRDLRDGSEFMVKGSVIINAAGPWSGKVASLAGSMVKVTAAAGAMVAVEGRLSNMVISRLRKPGDGDIIVPQRGLSIIGSTLRTVEDPDGLCAKKEEVEFLLSAADELMPGFSRQTFRAAWAAARPLAGESKGDGRSISRDLALIDHGKTDGIKGFFSILGGKATTLRIMGEIVADAVVEYLGNDEPCRTAVFDLYPYEYFWRLS